MASFSKILFYLIVTIALFSGCNNTKQEGSSEGNLKVLIEGRVIDGYIENATVFLDRNHNDTLDATEPYTTTDDVGFYSFEVENQYITDEYRVVAIGGRDTLLNQEFKSILRNIPTNTYLDKLNLSPATTLVGRYLKKTHATLDRSNQKVADFIGISKSEVVKDPIEEANSNIHLYKQNLKLHKVLESSAKYIFDDTTPRFVSDVADSFVPIMNENKTLSQVDTVKIERLNWDPKYIKPVSDRVQQVVENDVTNVHVDPLSTMYDELKMIVKTPRRIVNHRPIIDFDNFSINEDTSYSGFVHANDEDNDTLIYNIEISPSHGNLELNTTTGAFVYTPHENFPNAMLDANDSFSYKASDEFVSSDMVQVNIRVVAINDPIVFSTPNHVDVIENNTSVIDVNVYDPDNEPITYSFTTAEANATFHINSDTGLITFRNPPDYEFAPSYMITVKASESNRQNGNSYTQDINVSIVDTNDEPPVLNPISDINISENTIANTIIGNIIFNQGDRNISSFTLVGDDNTDFTIDNNGSILVSNSAVLDYETTRRDYNLTVQASNGQLSNIIPLNIHILDVPDVVPVLDNIAITIDENITLGSIIGTVPVTTHGDTNITLYEFVTSDPNFEVNSTTGEIYVSDLNTTNLDRDIVPHAPLENKTYNLTLKARNDFNYSSEITVDITVNDIADELPILSDFNISVAEDKGTNYSLGIIPLEVGDWTISEANLTGTGSENFTIDNSGNIKVSSSSNLDFESNSSYTLNARVLNDTGEDNATIIITITDIADIVPTLGSDVNGSISENATADTTILDMNITDIGDRNITGYSITGTGNELFKIETDGTNGILKLKNSASLDYDTTPSYTLSIKALNDAGYSNVVIANITITDVADIKPTISNDTFHINEMQEIPFVLGRLDYIDGDRNVTRFDLNDTSLFDVNITGYISLKNNYTLDFEVKNIYNYTVTATNEAGISEEANVTIYVDNNTSEVGLELVKAIYDVGQTTALSDDILYIFFNTNVNEGSLSNPADEYTITSGNGAFDTALTHETYAFTNNIYYRDKIKLNNSSEAFKPYVSELSIKEPPSGSDDTIKTDKGQIPLNYNNIQVYAFNPFVSDATYSVVEADDNKSVYSSKLGIIWNNDMDENGSYSALKSYCENSNDLSHDDWRLPTIQEMLTIINTFDDNSSDGLAYSSFYKVGANKYWTSNTREDNGSQNWAVDISTGETLGYNVDDEIYGICVRENNNTKYDASKPVFVRNDSSEVVIDYSTNLVWQDNNNSDIIKTKSGARDDCSNLDISGIDDWVLPTMRELATIIDYTNLNPVVVDEFVNKDYNSTTTLYWTDNLYEPDSNKAWSIDLKTGDIKITDTNESLRVVCVKKM
jgi:hypothetical protein